MNLLEPPGWVNWNQWLTTQNWPPYSQHTIGKEKVLLAAGNAGAFGFIPGSRKAFWNGIANYLGFEPRMVRGTLQIHRLDFEKNILPLLSDITPLPSLGRRIVIDPGHGGRNPGSRSLVSNFSEKDYTLDWARRLQPLLEAKGWIVILTRTNDTDVSLSERVDLAQQTSAELFVSLHFNSAFPHQEVQGIETYCTTPQGMSSLVTRDFPDETARAFPNNDFDSKNLPLALLLHRTLLTLTDAPDRGVRRARFMDVLRWQNRPAVLIEGGYMSSPAEARKIHQPAYRQKLAEAVAIGLESW